MVPWAWKLAALVGTAAGVAFLGATTPIVRESVWLATVSLSFLAALVAASRTPPSRRYPWYLVAGCQGLFVLANLLGNPLWATPTTAAWAIPVAIGAFPLLALAALAFSRSQVPGGDRESAIDGGIVMVAMAAVLTATAYQPELFSRDAASIGGLYAVVAPLLTSAVVAASIRLLFTGGVRLPAAWIYVGAATMGLVGNTFRFVLIANGTYERGTPTDLLLLAAHVLIAMACLHPSAVLLTQPADPRLRQFTIARFAVLGVALVAIPLTLLVRGVDESLVPTLVGAVLVSLLVLWRLSRLAVERQEAHEQLRRAAAHDVLTGLPNRRLLLDRLAQALARQARDGSPVGVLFVDLDGFKRVNDDRGHQVGDELLIMVARRLEEIVRRSDTVGRLGGDEFVLICDVADDATANALHRLGTRLAWEDVGTGFSSIPHLRGWPLDILKLDGSLARSAVEQVGDAGMIRAVCAVAHELGIEVLAEHVDSAQALATVEELGCDLGQGSHLGRPVTAEELRLPRVADAAGAPPDRADPGWPHQPVRSSRLGV